MHKYVQSLVQHSTMQFIVHRFAIGTVFFEVAVTPDPQTQDKPTQGEAIKGYTLSSQFPRSASWQGSDHGTEFDAVSDHRHRCQCYPRIGHRYSLLRTPSNVIPHEEAVPSCLLRLVG